MLKPLQTHVQDVFKHVKLSPSQSGATIMAKGEGEPGEPMSLFSAAELTPKPEPTQLFADDDEAVIACHSQVNPGCGH